MTKFDWWKRWGHDAFHNLSQISGLDVVDGVGLAADTGTNLGLDLVSEDEGFAAEMAGIHVLDLRVEDSLKMF